MAPNNRILPLEIIDHILSFADYLELYRYRQVSHIWQRLVEQRIFDNARRDPLILTHDDGRELGLVAHNFDTTHKVIEFQPCDGTLLVAKNDTFPPSIFARMVRLFFKPWKTVSMPGGLPEKYYCSKENIALPDNYNPAFEQRYMLPASSSIHTAAYEPHFIAKRGIIMSFSYVHRPDVQQQRRELERQIATDNSNHDLLPINQRGYPLSITATTHWLPRPCGIQVHWVKASLAWVISGFHPYVSVPPLYPERYNYLQSLLGEKYRIFRYDIYSEPVTKYILHPQKNGDDDTLSKDLINFLRTYTEDDDLSIESRLSQVERTLEQENIDPRVIWKYRFVRYGIVTNFAPGNSRDAIITRILAAEKRVQEEKRSIINQYKNAVI